MGYGSCSGDTAELEACFAARLTHAEFLLEGPDRLRTVMPLPKEAQHWSFTDESLLGKWEMKTQALQCGLDPFDIKLIIDGRDVPTQQMFSRFGLQHHDYVHTCDYDSYV